MTDKPESTSASNNSETPQNGGENSVFHQLAVAVKHSQAQSDNSASPPRYRSQPLALKQEEASNSWVIVAAVAVMGLGLWFNLLWLGLPAALIALFLSLQIVLPSIQGWIVNFLTPDERRIVIGTVGLVLAIAGLFKYLRIYRVVRGWLNQLTFDEFGSWAEWVGALGQISIAVLAVYVAWEQYVISRDLTIQQNRITQQQTIDTYFQGVSDLALNEEGLLEDWPQERAIAEGRTAAIFSSVDASGKAKILRFLSQSRLLTPLLRDRHLGRPILDGSGGYAEDRAHGLRVIDLGVMLAGTDLSGQDLRWTDISEANMVRVNLSYGDLVKANLSRTVLYEANLTGADFKGTRLFYGSVETASPRSRTVPPDYSTGARTGAVVEKANFTGAQRLSEEQRCYLCAWGGEETRATIPGGCEGISNKLGR